MSAWESLKTFYRIPWLRRLWVLQEVALSSSAIVLWGNTEVSWDIVGRASEVIQDDHNLWNAVDQRTGVGNAYLMHSLRNSNPPLHSFRTLLQRARRFETTDPRDRIFAVLGLSTTDRPTGDGTLFLEPDYTLTVPQLYLAVAQRIIESDQNLGLLSAVQLRHRDLGLQKEMPTWVPRWNNFSVNILAGVDGKSHKVAAGLSVPDPVYSIKESGFLVVHGLEIDVITRTTEKMAEDDFRLSDVLAKSHANSHLWRRRFDELLNQPIEPHLKALAWAMTAGKDWADEPIGNPESHWLDFQMWWTSISLQNGCTLDPDGQCSHDDNGGNIKRFLVAASDCWDRRLFMTETGFIGLGPEVLRVGDRVCVLAGGPVPYILREGHEHYLFIGESYVYGIMEGEAVRLWREGRLSLKKIELH